MLDFLGAKIILYHRDPHEERSLVKYSASASASFHPAVHNLVLTPKK